MITARDHGLWGCPNCGRVHALPLPKACLRCGHSAQASAQTDRSLQYVWAWWLAGLIAYIPANVYPMLITRSFGSTSDSTIMGGVIELVHYGSYSVAAIVFIASIAIPVGKFVAIAYLALSLQYRRRGGPRSTAKTRFLLYEVVEFIGRWSMIDVFVVAILAALVQLDFAASINPGLAAISFALSVAFTMLSAQSFNPKAIWADPGPPRL
ncbi:MAG: paraquat-inducible protein A [Pseudomonadota bacterium]